MAAERLLETIRTVRELTNDADQIADLATKGAKECRAADVALASITGYAYVAIRLLGELVIEVANLAARVDELDDTLDHWRREE